MSTKCIKVTAQRGLSRSCILLFGLLLSLSIQAQNRISGNVTSEDGEGLPGANVIIKGTTNGTVTDIDGNYSLEASPEATLVFSFVGYAQQEVRVGNQNVLNVQLGYDMQSLSEVVVVGYGSMARSNVTGAISSIDKEELEKVPVPNVVEAMRGQIPGLRMTRTSGAPGSGVNFLIRGKNSLGSSNEPLIVIDGVPTTGGNIAEINPSDVANINIMKDAAAASIYGARGANGVILITTKNGSRGKPTLNVKFSQGVTDLAIRPDFMNAEEYVQLKIDAAEGAGLDSELEDVLTDPIELENYNAGREIDWHDVVLQKGKQTNAGISLSAGSDKITLYLNADAYLEEGIALQTDYNRYSFRLNSEYEPYDFLKIGTRIQLTATNSEETGGLTNPVAANSALFVNFINNTPLGRLRNEEGELVPTIKGDQFQYNPLFKYRESEANRQTTRTYINPYVEVKLLDGLKYTLNTFVERRTSRYNMFRSSRYNASTLADEPGLNDMQISHNEPVTYLVDNILNYQKTFAQKHSVSATAVYGFQKYSRDSLTLTNEGTNTDLITYHDIAFEAGNRATGFDTDEWGILYFVGRLGYTFNNRYVITGTLRYDGSTRFGPERRWGTFPSISAAWNLHEEVFMSGIDVLNTLKFRASYGTMGNDQIGSYGYLSLAQGVSYPFNQQVYGGLIAGGLPNPFLQWETSQQTNFGVDFAVWQSRVFGSVDVYKTNTVDLLLNKRITAVSGDSSTPPSVISNVGETENRGVEVNLNVNAFVGEFQWEIGLNWARDRNEIIRLNDAVDEDGNPLDDQANNWFIGQDIDVVYNYDVEGIYQEGEEDLAAERHPTIFGYGPGDPKIRDVNDDGVITFDDQTFLGTATPDWYGGIRNTFRYKGFELTVLFETVQGVTRVNGFYGALTGRSNGVNVDYWTPEDPSAEFPQPDAQAEYRYGDAVRVKDASFVSLRNVSLSYSLPSALMERVRLKSMQVYVRGNNLKYFTDYVGYSPETNFGAFPITKVWTVGTSITF